MTLDQNSELLRLLRSIDAALRVLAEQGRRNDAKQDALIQYVRGVGTRMEQIAHLICVAHGLTPMSPEQKEWLARAEREAQGRSGAR